MSTRISDVLASVEREYVHAINAVLGSSGVGPDPDRWRGHAEAHRLNAERLRTALHLPPVNYTSAEWRDANGVYNARTVDRWRQQARAERNHEQRDECPHCGGDLTQASHD